MARTEKIVKEYKTIISNLQERLNESSSFNYEQENELKRLRQEKLRIDHELTGAQGDQLRLKFKLHTALNEIQRLTKVLHDVSTSRSDLQTAYEQAIRKLEQYNPILRELDFLRNEVRKIPELTKQLASAQKKLRDTQSALQNYQTANRIAVSQSEAKAAENASLLSQFYSMQAEKEELDKQLSAYATKLQWLKINGETQGTNRFESIDLKKENKELKVRICELERIIHDSNNPSTDTMGRKEDKDKRTLKMTLSSPSLLSLTSISSSPSSPSSTTKFSVIRGLFTR